MTKNEVIKILAVCKGAGVQFGDSDKNVLVEIWSHCFEKESYTEVSKALYKLIQSKEPLYVNGLIGRIKEKIVEDKVNFIDFSTAWEMIRKAMHKTHPDISSETTKAFQSLPPILQHLVGSARHLEDMEYCLDRDTLETVEKSNLRKMYAELVIKSKEQMALGVTPVYLEGKELKKLGKVGDEIKKIAKGHSF